MQYALKSCRQARIVAVVGRPGQLVLTNRQFFHDAIGLFEDPAELRVVDSSAELAVLQIGDKAQVVNGHRRPRGIIDMHLKVRILRIGIDRQNIPTRECILRGHGNGDTSRQSCGTQQVQSDCRSTTRRDVH